MKIISLKCNSCGSDLKVNEDTKFFNCSFCGSSLALEKSGNAVFTKVLKEIKGDTKAILKTSEKLLVEKQIARLDREWKRETEDYDLEDIEKGGGVIGSILGLVFFIIFAFGVFQNSQQSSFHHSIPAPMIIFFMLFGVVIFFSVMASIIKSIENNSDRREYEKRESVYEKRRRALLIKLKK